MYTNRFFTLLIVIALMAVVALTVREASATIIVVSDVDSATRSYTYWAKVVESRSKAVDSATRSYIAWANAVECGTDSAYEDTVDSATRSYISWAKAVEAKSHMGGSCR